MELCKTASAIYGSEAWFSREKELVILRTIDRAMVRAKCGVKQMDL